MRDEETVFHGGPLDGRRLRVALGPTGRPPRTYRVPVPQPDGMQQVHRYRLAPAMLNRLGLPKGWRYDYEGTGAPVTAWDRLPWRRRGPNGKGGRPGTEQPGPQIGPDH